jgi:hypothetical protein
MTLRLLLINRLDTEKQELVLATLRLFDTILETYNQFAIYNLVLRNYLDISPEGEYIDDTKDTTDTSSLGSKVVDDRGSVTTVEDHPRAEESASGEKEVSQKESKNEKVRWLVER